MDPLAIIFFVVVIIFSAVIHEYMHGWVADRLGDPTARYAGRLTLNPIKHIDMFGSIILPIVMVLLPGSFLFAYAKPVPYNPFNLRDQKWGPVWVAIAGPLSNFFLALVFGLLIRFLPLTPVSAFFGVIVLANIALGIFNLVPIPPLDGSKVLYAVLPDTAYKVKQFLQRYGIVVLLIFIFYFASILTPLIDTLFQWFTGYSLGVFFD